MLSSSIFGFTAKIFSITGRYPSVFFRSDMNPGPKAFKRPMIIWKKF